MILVVEGAMHYQVVVLMLVPVGKHYVEQSVVLEREQQVVADTV